MTAFSIKQTFNRCHLYYVMRYQIGNLHVLYTTHCKAMKNYVSALFLMRYWMPYQYCHQCNVGWAFLAILIASCVVAVFHANRGNPDYAIWPIRFFKILTYTWKTHFIEEWTRQDLKKYSWRERSMNLFWFPEAIEKAREDLSKYSWRERFLAAWFAWISIGIVAYIGLTNILTMIGAITVIWTPAFSIKWTFKFIYLDYNKTIRQISLIK